MPVIIVIDDSYISFSIFAYEYNPSSKSYEKKLIYELKHDKQPILPLPASRKYALKYAELVGIISKYSEELLKDLNGTEQYVQPDADPVTDNRDWVDIYTAEFDFDGDNEEEKLVLKATVDYEFIEGRFRWYFWKETQRWNVCIIDGGKEILLFDGYNRLGYVEVSFQEIDIDTAPEIMVIDDNDKKLTIISYKYNPKTNTYDETVILDMVTEKKPVAPIILPLKQ